MQHVSKFGQDQACYGAACSLLCVCVMCAGGCAAFLQQTTNHVPCRPACRPEHPCKRGACDGTQDRCLIDGHRPEGSKCHWTKLPHGVVWPRAAAMSVVEEEEEAEEMEASDDEQAAAVTARLAHHHKYPVCHGKCRRGRCHGTCPADKHKAAGAKPHSGTADNKTPTKAVYEL